MFISQFVYSFAEIIKMVSHFEINLVLSEKLSFLKDQKNAVEVSDRRKII